MSAYPQIREAWRDAVDNGDVLLSDQPVVHWSEINRRIDGLSESTVRNRLSADRKIIGVDGVHPDMYASHGWRLVE